LRSFKTVCWRLQIASADGKFISNMKTTIQQLCISTHVRWPATGSSCGCIAAPQAARTYPGRSHHRWQPHRRAPVSKRVRYRWGGVKGSGGPA
jgi:hypothetical protein